MKAFLEEYGLVIVIVLVVTMLIGVAAFVSANGKKSLEKTYTTFDKIAGEAVDEAADDWATHANPDSPTT